MANSWAMFEELMQKSRRTICKIVSTDSATKRVLVEQSGDLVRLYVESNGTTYVNGSYVFVEGGVIVGQAPTVREIVSEILY